MYIGKIAVDTPIDNPTAVRKVKVGKKIITVEFSGPTENISFFDKVYVFAAYCFEQEEKKAFKVLNEIENEGGTLLWVDYKETESVYILTTENFENPHDKNMSLENFFHGVAEVEIVDSFELLEKKYNPSNKHKLYIIFGVLIAVFLVGVALVILNLSKPKDVEKVQNIENNATKKALSPIEVINLKKALSIMFIDKVHSEAISLMNDELLNSKASIRSIVFSYDLGNNDVAVKGSFGYEFKYPVRGSVLSSGNVYSKTIPFVIKSNEIIFPKIDHALSEQCVKDAIGILGSNFITVTERTNNLIKINYKEMQPDIFVGGFKNMLNDCPIYLENVVVSDNGTFEVSATMYDKDIL